jgi:hypothetical protein
MALSLTIRLDSQIQVRFGADRAVQRGQGPHHHRHAVHGIGCLAGGGAVDQAPPEPLSRVHDLGWRGFTAPARRS